MYQKQIIDFHTHIFPDDIAEKTIQKVANMEEIPFFLDGRKQSLLASMKEAGIDYSLVLPVVTKPEQFRSVNQWAAKINGKEGLFSFGGIHPHSKEYKKELECIKAFGLRGIKLHPDNQDTFIYEESYCRIIKYALKLDLFITFHCGRQKEKQNNCKCMPKDIKRMLQKVSLENQKDTRIILAHMGGIDSWNEVEEFLVGQNVYLDISYAIGRIKSEQFLRICQNHGIENILFATDSPWTSQKRVVEQMKEIGLTDKELEQICWKNGAKILNLIESTKSSTWMPILT